MEVPGTRMRMMVLLLVAALAFGFALLVGQRLLKRRMRRRLAARWKERERC